MDDMRSINSKLKSVSNSYLAKRDQNDQQTNETNSTVDGSSKVIKRNNDNVNKFEQDL